MRENHNIPPKEPEAASTAEAIPEGVSLSDMSKPPAFQFYANDFMGSTITWDAIACGMYIRLLCTQWVNGSIPDDQRRIARAAGVELAELQREWHLLGPKFPLTKDGVRKNARLEAVRDRQAEISDLRRRASEVRWSDANGSSNAHPNDNAKRKQRKVKEKEKIEGEIQGKEPAREKPTVPFEQWWTIYRKGSRKLSAEQWDRLNDTDRKDCIAATPAYLASKPDPQYRKDGERFLRHRTWEDPIVEAAAAPTKPMTKDEARAELARIRERLGIPPGGILLTEQIPEHVRQAMAKA